MADSSLDVSLHGERIATVTRSSQRSLSLVNLTWNDDFSAGLVRLSESFAAFPGVTPNTRLVSSFLGGYAPEGNQRRAMAAERGIPQDDLFGLLREFGGSIAGALTFQLPGDNSISSPGYETLGDSSLRRVLQKAVTDFDLGIQDDSRSMIPGFQPKVLVATFDGQTWLQPHGRAHSTHILKPQLSSKPSKLYDEFYSHELTRSMGLSHFSSSIQSVGEQKFLAIERFDRVVSNEIVSLLHQEDTAQAMGIDWVDADSKFQSRERPHSVSRPSLRRMAELYGTLNDPSALRTWLRQVTYRILVGDNDGHAKNYGILHLDGLDTPTEIYDAVPNLYQDGRIEWNMAFSIDGHFDHRKMSIERIVDEASRWGSIDRKDAEDVVQSTVEDFLAALDAVSVPSGLSEGLRPALEWNAERMSAGQEISQRR